MTRKYFNTQFNRANFNLLFEVDEAGVRSEADARGSKSGLYLKIEKLDARKLKAAEKALEEAILAQQADELRATLTTEDVEAKTAAATKGAKAKA